MKHVGLVSHVLVAGLLCVFSARAPAQEDSHPLPENWQELPLATFVSEVDLMMDDQEQAFTRTEPVIDHIWSSGPHLVAKYREIRSRLAARMLSLATDPEYLTTCENDPKAGAAHVMLDNAALRCSSASSVEALAAWRKEIFELADQLEKYRNKEEALAQQAYKEALHRRLRRAEQRGHQQAVADYKELLAAAGAEIK